MAELKNQVEQAQNTLEKVIAEQTGRFEAAVTEFTKWQTKGIAQANALFDDVVRVTREQIAFAEQLGAEWRKLMIASTKSASEIFAPKA